MDHQLVDNHSKPTKVSLAKGITVQSSYVVHTRSSISTTVASSIESITGVGGRAGRKSKRSDRLSTRDGQGDGARKAWPKKVASPQVDRSKIRPTHCKLGSS